MVGAMGATKYLAVRLDPVTDHTASTMAAGRRHRVDRAFEAVERHRSSCETIWNDLS
jgi:hypothetical protein